MKRAKRLFNAAARKTVAEAIACAEKKTSAEIVPVAATASGRYDRGEDLFGLVFALVVTAAGHFIYPLLVEAGVGWNGERAAGPGLPVILLLVLVGFLAGSLLASLFPSLRTPFVSRREMEAEVERSALAAFLTHGVRGTKGGTGILIYLSLYEQIVRILPDESIAAQLPESAFQEIRDLVIAEAAEGKIAEGLATAIRKTGDLLCEPFPIGPGDENEIPNELHILN